MSRSGGPVPIWGLVKDRLRPVQDRSQPPCASCQIYQICGMKMVPNDSKMGLSMIKSHTAVTFCYNSCTMSHITLQLNTIWPKRDLFGRPVLNLGPQDRSGPDHLSSLDRCTLVDGRQENGLSVRACVDIHILDTLPDSVHATQEPILFSPVALYKNTGGRCLRARLFNFGSTEQHIILT